MDAPKKGLYVFTDTAYPVCRQDRHFYFRSFLLSRKASNAINKLPKDITVPAAIRELEKIEMTRQLDKVYRLDHAVTKTQKVILSAFDIDAAQVKYKANYISEILKGR